MIRELLKLRILARSPIIYRAGLKNSKKRLTNVPATDAVEIIGPVGSGRIGRFSFEVIQLEPGPDPSFQNFQKPRATLTNIVKKA